MRTGMDLSPDNNLFSIENSLNFVDILKTLKWERDDDLKLTCFTTYKKIDTKNLTLRSI